VWTRLGLAISVSALLLVGVAISIAGASQPQFYANSSSQSGLKILRAWYGSASNPNNGRDVTQIVVEALARGDKSITVSNSNFTDTASGEHKKLWVKYSVRQRENTITVDEDGVLDFSLLAQVASAPQTQRFNTPRTVVIPIPATSLAYSTRLQKLYATVGSVGPGSLTNSLVQINPTTGAVEKSIYVGSAPSNAIVGSQDKNVFVTLEGGQSVVSIDLDSFKVGATFPVGPSKVVSMFSLADFPNGILVQRKLGDYEYELLPFVDGKSAGAAARCHLHTVAAINNNRFYSYESQISPSSCGRLIAGPRMAFSTYEGSPPFQGNIGLVGSLCGLMVNNQGTVVDPETNQIVGSLNTGFASVLALDTVRPQVYCLEGERGPTKLGIYSLNRYTKVGDVELGGGVTGGGTNLIRWADNGIAFLQSDKIVCSQLNLGPAAKPVDLSIERSKPSRSFEAGSVVSYKLTVSNRGPSPSTGACVTETLPSGVTVQSALSSQAQVVVRDGFLQAELGAIPPNGQVTIDVKVLVERLEKPTFVGVVRSLDLDTDTANNLALPFGVASVSSGEVKAAGPDLMVKLNDVMQRSSGSGVNLESWVVGKVTITNQGSRASQRCLARFYLEEGPRLVVPEALLLQEVEVPPLRPGESTTLTLNVPLGNADATGNWFIATLDPTHVNNDIDPSNDEASAKI